MGRKVGFFGMSAISLFLVQSGSIANDGTQIRKDLDQLRQQVQETIEGKLDQLAEAKNELMTVSNELERLKKKSPRASSDIESAGSGNGPQDEPGSQFTPDPSPTTYTDWMGSQPDPEPSPGSSGFFGGSPYPYPAPSSEDQSDQDIDRNPNDRAIEALRRDIEDRSRVLSELQEDIEVFQRVQQLLKTNDLKALQEKAEDGRARLAKRRKAVEIEQLDISSSHWSQGLVESGRPRGAAVRDFKDYLSFANALAKGRLSNIDTETEYLTHILKIVDPSKEAVKEAGELLASPADADPEAAVNDTSNENTESPPIAPAAPPKPPVKGSAGN